MEYKWRDTYMKCPKCEKDMRIGYLQSTGRRIIWDTKKHSILLEPSNDGIIISETFINVSTVDPAYCCKDCRIIVFQYEDITF